MSATALFSALALGALALLASRLARRLLRLRPRGLQAAHPRGGEPPPEAWLDPVSLGLALADLAAVAFCLLGSFVLRLDWSFHRTPAALSALVGLYAVTAAKPLIFDVFGLYRRDWRYAGARDFLSLGMAVTAASAAASGLLMAAVLVGGMPAPPLSVLAIDWLLTLACVAGLRLSVRLALERFYPPEAPATPAGRPRRILVAGAGDTGALVVRELQRNPQLGMEPIGFLDDQATRLGKHILGVPVLGTLADLEREVAGRRIDEVVIAMPTAPGARIREIVDACRRADVTSRAMPGLFELLDGGVSVSRLREVEVGDLLRRAPVPARPDAGLYLQNAVVLVTGAGGSIGSELCRQVARAGASEVVLVGHGENTIFDVLNLLVEAHPHVRFHPVIGDVRHLARMRDVFRRYRPAIVFHAAAHKHVPLMETQPEEAVANNVEGTRSVVQAAIEHGVERFVLISTDKAVAPTSAMGATKRLAELIVRDASRETGRAFSVVRFGNVLGSRGSVVPLFQRQIARGGPVTITHPAMTRFFMTVSEAVYLVVKAGGLAAGGELFVLNMGEPVRIVDLALDLIRLSGFSGDEIPIVYTGLRLGDKLEEALWEPGAICEPVGDDDVLRVVEPNDAPMSATLHQKVDALVDAARRVDVPTIEALLADLLPSFTPWRTPVGADAPAPQSTFAPRR